MAYQLLMSYLMLKFDSFQNVWLQSLFSMFYCIFFLLHFWFVNDQWFARNYDIKYSYLKK